MEIHTEPVFKLTPEYVLSIDIQQTLLCQSLEADKLVKNIAKRDNIVNYVFILQEETF